MSHQTREVRRPWRATDSDSAEGHRVLIDTNVWRYVIDAQSGGALLRAARTGAHDVQIAPAVVYETLRLRDARLRGALIRLMTNTGFKRLMTEAYSESMEVLREIERARPHWLRTSPDLVFFKKAQNDWRKTTGGFWVDCARAPQDEAARLAMMGDDEIGERGRAQSEQARREMRDIGWKKNPPMDKTVVGFQEPRPGWRGDPFEAWRMDSYIGLTYALQRTGNAYRDWIAPFVDLDSGLLYSADWLQFWVYDAQTAALPRQWMRWAHAFAQRFRKVTPGSPADTQLASYFLETDMVVSADKALLEILDECRPYAPSSLPAGMLIPGGNEGVRALLAALES
jgi:hypothetical protein